MTVSIDTIIFYVNDIDKLKTFYTTIFAMEVIEEFESEWVLLKGGSCKLGLHKIGEKYQNDTKAHFKIDSNCKIVFEVKQDINEARNKLLLQNVLMREIKTFDNYDHWLCDGEDPEGNVFQLKVRKKQDVI